MALRFQFSIRHMLGLLTLASIAGGANQLINDSKLGSSPTVGCVLAVLTIGAPALLAVAAADARGYWRAVLIGGLVPALAAATFFCVALHGSYDGYRVVDFKSFEMVIGRMIYYRHALALIWAVIPVGGIVGLFVHWFSGPHVPSSR